MAVYQGLVDHRGRPIEKAVLTQTVAAASTTGVRSPLAGYPGDGLTPPRLTQILREADQGQPLRFYELAEQIEERDLHYAAVLAVRKRSVSQLEITIEDASDKPEHKAQAQMVRDWLKRDELKGDLFDILDAIGKGESFTEIGWDTSEGQWQPKTLDWRDPRWFKPKLEDLTTPTLLGEDGVYRELPAGKFIHLVARGKSGLPARSGLARLASWFWLFKSMTVRDWAIYTATFGQPLRVGKYGAGASETDKDTLFRAVANIAGDCAAIIPQSMVIEFVQPPSGTTAGGKLYEDRADWLDQQMSKATLGQTTTTDAISGGHAVSQEHRLVQEDIERADAGVLGPAITRDLIIPWIQLQYGPQEAYPRVRIGRPEQKDIEQTLSVVKALRLPMKKTEAYALAGVSQPDAGDDVIVPSEGTAASAMPGDALATVPPGGAGKTPPARPTLHATQTDPGVTEADQEQLAIDALAGETSDLTAPMMQAVLELVAGIVAHATSLEDVRVKLLELSPEIPTKSLALAMRQAQLVARLSGRAGLLDG